MGLGGKVMLEDTEMEKNPEDCFIFVWKSK